MDVTTGLQTWPPVNTGPCLTGEGRGPGLWRARGSDGPGALPDPQGPLRILFLYQDDPEVLGGKVVLILKTLRIRLVQTNLYKRKADIGIP